METAVRRVLLLSVAVMLPMISTGCRALVAHNDHGLFCLEAGGGQLKIDLKSNDKIRDDELQVEIVLGEFTSGEDLLTLVNVDQETGEFCFTPEEGADGIACFEYTLQSVVAEGEEPITSNDAKVKLYIRGVDGAPIAVADEATTTPGESVKINVLRNDTWTADSPERHGLSIQSVAIDAELGTAEIVQFGPHCEDEDDNGEGEGDDDDDDGPVGEEPGDEPAASHGFHGHCFQFIRYTPASDDLIDPVTFSYTIVDECGKTATAQVTVNFEVEEPEPPVPGPEPPVPGPELPAPGPTTTTVFVNDSGVGALLYVNGDFVATVQPGQSTPNALIVPAGTVQIEVKCPGDGEPVKANLECVLAEEGGQQIRFFDDGVATVVCEDEVPPTES